MQDDVGGLQVFKEGNWHGVSPVPGAFVINIGDMMQVHIHLAWAHRASNLLEYIPWMLDCFEDPVTIKEGWFAAPQQPGAGTTLKPEALEKFNVL